MVNKTTKANRITHLQQAGAAAAFIALVGLLMVFFSNLLIPTFGHENDGVRGMYQQPRNSIQVACFGGSSMAAAFAPDYLYSQYGISSYNTSSSNQSMMAAYYLLRDMVGRQENKLSLVILDAMPLVKSNSTFNTYVWSERVAANMPLSLNKLRFLKDISDEYSGYSASEHLLPILSYHDRWSELTGKDFERALNTHVDNPTHGQNYGSISFTSNGSKGKWGKYTADNIPSITASKDFSDEELRATLNELSARYANKIVDLCNDKGIRVLFIKTPASEWTDKEHDSVQFYSEEAGADFLDMSLPDVWAETGLSFDNDYRDGKHVNFTGGLKATDYIGKYLSDHYELENIGGSESLFTESDMGIFNNMIASSKLLYCNDLMSYIQMLKQDRYTIFVAAGSNASKMLTDEVRAELKAMGLTKLASIDSEQAYVGILSNGKCIAQKTADSGEKASIVGTYENGIVTISQTSMQPGATLKNPLSLAALNQNVSIRVNDKKLSEANEGINFVVYDEDLGLRVDTSSFDMRMSPNRVSDQAPLTEQA